MDKYFRLKTEPNSRGKLVTKIENDVVFFADNGRVDINTFYEKFVETASNNQINESVNPPIVAERIDEYSGFSSNFGNGFLDAMKQLQSGGKVDYSTKDIGDTTGIVEKQKSDSLGLDDLSPETAAWAAKQDQENEQRRIKLENDQREWAIKQNMTVNGKPSTYIVTPETHIEQYSSDGYYSDSDKSSVVNSKPEPPEKQILNKMKNTKSVVLDLKFNEMIPKIEDIKSVQSIFEDLPIVEYIAERIADKYINDRELLVGKIIEQLEKKMKKPKVSRVTTKRATK